MFVRIIDWILWHRIIVIAMLLIAIVHLGVVLITGAPNMIVSGLIGIGIGAVSLDFSRRSADIKLNHYNGWARYWFTGDQEGMMYATREWTKPVTICLNEYQIGYEVRFGFKTASDLVEFRLMANQ